MLNADIIGKADPNLEMWHCWLDLPAGKSRKSILCAMAFQKLENTEPPLPSNTHKQQK